MSESKTTPRQCVIELRDIIAELPAGDLAARLNSVTEEIIKHMSKKVHWSDCAVYNEPYKPNGICDCGKVEVLP